MAVIERYKNKHIEYVWSDKHKFGLWEQVSMYYLNNILKQKDHSYTYKYPHPLKIQDIYDLEKKTKHEFVAFLFNLNNRLEHHNEPNLSKYLHHGLTSSDIIDTVSSIQIKQSIGFITTSILNLREVLIEKIELVEGLNVVGRTHGKHAELISLQDRFHNFFAAIMELNADLIRIESGMPGKLTGPVGSSNHVNSIAAKETLKKFRLRESPSNTQVIPRRNYTEFVYTLALLLKEYEQFAINVRLLAIDEVNEFQEGFLKGQTGSSAMPHKNNPISSENICGMSRLMQRNLDAALNNIPLWLERDISHSSVERVIWPESFHIAMHATEKITSLIEGLVINKESIDNNIKNSPHLKSHQELLQTKSRFSSYFSIQEKYKR
jgi:adenylosuccinate lyase